MAKRINENIRVYTEQDPYHVEVDNLPIYDLLNNDKALQEQVDDLVKGTDSIPVSRRNLEELRPYLGRVKIGSVEYQAAFVKPGKFTARINSPAEIKNGLYEEDPSASGNVEGSVNAVDNLNSQAKSQSVSGVGRTAVVELRKRVDGKDQYILVEPFDPVEWSDNNPGNIARIDVVYVRAYPAVDQNGNSLASAPSIGILKGAGIVTGNNTGFLSNQKSRMTDSLGTRAHMFADADDNEGYGITLSSGEVISVGSIPVPEDLLNSFESRIIQAEGGESYNATYLPLAYIVVPSTYRSTTDTIDSENISDIRPLFRTTELMLDERQAIMFSKIRPSIENPFATELSVKSQIDGIKFPEPKPGDPGKPGNPADLGVSLVGMGVIRGGIDYGPEFYFPEAKAWYTGWDGKPDWDIMPQGIRNDSGNMKVGTASYNSGDYTWLVKSMLCSKKTVGVTIPEGFSYYFVDAEYLYSVPIQDTDYNQLDYQRFPRGTYNFVQPGLSVHVTPSNFTIVTKSYNYFGTGGGDRPAGSLMGAYTFMLDNQGNPTYYDESVQNYSGGIKQDPRFDKTRTYAGTSASEGYVHILPTVIYKVYAVKSSYLTTGGTLKRII